MLSAPQLNSETETTAARQTRAEPHRVRRALYHELRADSPPSLPPSPPAEDHPQRYDEPALAPASTQRTRWSLRGASIVLNVILAVILMLISTHRELFTGAYAMLLPLYAGATTRHTLDAASSFAAFATVGMVASCL
eukprot:1705736-Pleurochrysis_carterae.AAC.1